MMPGRRRDRSARAETAGEQPIPAQPAVPATRRRGAAEPATRARRAKPTGDAFGATLGALEGLAASGAQVSLHVVDIDRGTRVVAGDDDVSYPIAGVGVVAVLLEAAARFDDATLDPAEVIDRADVDVPAAFGLWNHLSATTFTLGDLAVLAAATGDPIATNALLQRVGIGAVHNRMQALGLQRLAVLDGFRDERGPDDAPNLAIGSTRETAALFSALVNSNVVSPAVSAQVAEWLNLNQDLGFVGSATGLDPFDHENDKYGLLFINKTGRAEGIRAEAGVLAGSRGGVAYAITVCFDDLSIVHRLRVHNAMRVLGAELMEYVF